MLPAIFPPKSVTLAANAANTITWSGNDFGPRFNESIIKQEVDIHFKVTNSTPNVLYISLSYTTLIETVAFQERINIAAVPANSSIELTKATVPAIGRLHKDIVSITLTLTSAAAGNVTVSLVCSDPADLSASSLAGPLLGKDTVTQQGYSPFVFSSGGLLVTPAGASAVNTAPSTGKRALIDLVRVSLPPTPSFPGLLIATATLLLAVGNVAFSLHSLDNEWNEQTLISALQYPLTDAESFQLTFTNNDTTNYTVLYSVLWREIF